MNRQCSHSSFYKARPLHVAPQRCCTRIQQPCVPACSTDKCHQRQTQHGTAAFGTALALALSIQTSVPLATHARENPLQNVQQSAMQSIEQTKQRSRSALLQAEENFENSELLKGLRAKSAENAPKYKKDRDSKYCYRQAELGVGDCAGLRLIPGATKSGKQKTPGWLMKILGDPKEDKGPVQLPDYLKD